MGKSPPPKRRGPQIQGQQNADLIDEALKEVNKLSNAQKQELIDAAGETETKKKVSNAIADQVIKPMGGGVLHHCARKRHKNQSQCISGGCIVPCDVCGAWISVGYKSQCRNCDAIEVGRRIAEEAEKKREEKMKRLEEEEKARGAKVRSAKKPKWSPDKKDQSQKKEQLAHDKELGLGEANMAHVIGSRVSKPKGRVGEKGRRGAGSKDASDSEDVDVGSEGASPRGLKRAKARMTPQQLTLKATLVLLEYCQDLLEAAYTRSHGHEWI